MLLLSAKWKAERAKGKSDQKNPDESFKAPRSLNLNEVLWNRSLTFSKNFSSFSALMAMMKTLDLYHLFTQIVKSQWMILPPKRCPLMSVSYPLLIDFLYRYYFDRISFIISYYLPIVRVFVFSVVQWVDHLWFRLVLPLYRFFLSWNPYSCSKICYVLNSLPLFFF